MYTGHLSHGGAPGFCYGAYVVRGFVLLFVSQLKFIFLVHYMYVYIGLCSPFYFASIGGSFKFAGLGLLCHLYSEDPKVICLLAGLIATCTYLDRVDYMFCLTVRAVQAVCGRWITQRAQLSIERRFPTQS